ncbi:hypothetical protein Ciccas_002935, partial [Cichlidogyrus casuarinus]
ISSAGSTSDRSHRSSSNIDREEGERSNSLSNAQAKMQFWQSRNGFNTAYYEEATSWQNAENQNWEADSVTPTAPGQIPIAGYNFSGSYANYSSTGNWSQGRNMYSPNLPVSGTVHASSDNFYSERSANDAVLVDLSVKQEPVDGHSSAPSPSLNAILFGSDEEDGVNAQHGAGSEFEASCCAGEAVPTNLVMCPIINQRNSFIS